MLNVTLAFNVSAWVRDNKSLIIDTLFYLMCGVLLAMVLSFFIFTYKISTINQKINELDKKILVYASEEQKASEMEVLNYKKKIDDFNTIINSHKISSKVFSFIEENTLPNVWFLSFSVSQAKGEINVLGEAENMEVLSSQVRVFESSKDYIKSINILNSQITQQGTTRFTLSLSLNQDIFKDTANEIK